MAASGGRTAIIVVVMENKLERSATGRLVIAAGLPLPPQKYTSVGNGPVVPPGIGIKKYSPDNRTV